MSGGKVPPTCSKVWIYVVCVNAGGTWLDGNCFNDGRQM